MSHERGPESKKSPLVESPERDLTDPQVQQEIIFAQDRKILEVVNSLAVKVKSCPPEMAYPEAEPQALIVGGFVRDAVLGKHPSDADVEVYGMSAKRLESLLDQLYPKKVDKIGRAFGIFSLSLEGVDLDISLPRRESKMDETQAQSEVVGDPTMTVEEAARRRDFSFNSMAADALTGKIYNPYHGLEDLQDHILRVTDRERFQDDPLRILRGMQFAARLDLKPDPESLALMQDMVVEGMLDKLSADRLTPEWKKLLLKPERPSIGFELGKRVGVFARLYPEIDRLPVQADLPAKTRKQAPSWEQLLSTLDRGASVLKSVKDADEYQKLQMMLAIVGMNLVLEKTTAKTLKSESPVEDFLNRFKFNHQKVNKPAARLVDQAFEPARIYADWKGGRLTETQMENEMRQVFKRIYPAEPQVLAALTRAVQDQPGQDFEESLPVSDWVKDLAVRHPEWLLEPNQMNLLTGKELQKLGFQGKDMGLVMRWIEAKRDAGEISTQDEARAILPRFKPV